jgi:8-oxo-dGTP pyrophosphatase MutT (NUDIX family)
VVLSLDEVARRLVERPARVIADEGSRRAAVAAVFREAPEGVELLFIRRAEHPADPWSGQIGFPGGGEEPGDVDLEETAVRETREELGLDLLARPGAARIGPLDEVRARARTHIAPLTIRPFAFRLGGSERPLLSPNAEVERAFWMPLSHLGDPARRAWYDAHRAEVPLRFPGVDCGDYGILWGLTHYMMVEILVRLGVLADADVEALSSPAPR